MRFLLLSILLIFIGINRISAQSDVKFTVFTKNYTTQKKESGITVKAFDGKGTLVSSGTSDGSGIVDLKLPPGKKYKVEVSKAGKVTRNFSVDVTGVTDEMIQGTSVISGSTNMSLFDQQPGVDYSYVTSNIATEFYYDPAAGNELRYDEVLAEKMVKKVDKIMKEADAAKGQSEAQYNALIKQADGQYNSKKYPEALASYEQALALKPTEKYPSDRINEIDGILKAEKANAQQAQQAAAEYQTLISSADNLFKQNKFEEAMARYNEALAKKSEQYPKDQIAKCQAEIARLKKEGETVQKYNDAIKAADAFLGQKSYQSARDKYNEALKFKQGDSYATGKLAEIEQKLNAQKADQEKKQKYDDAMAAGETAFSASNWEAAKTKFKEAQTIDPAQTLPKERISDVDKKIAEEAAAKANKAKYDAAITAANGLLATNKLPEAKAKYQEAATLDPSQSLPKQKISEIEGLMAGAEKQKQVDALLKAGDAALAKKDAATARTKYQEVLTMDAGNAIASAKMQEVAKLENEMAGEAQKEARFKQLKDEATALMGQSKYLDAKQKLTETKAIKQDAQIDKLIAECDTKIAEQKTQQANQAKVDADYKAAMKRGDDAFALKNYTDAIKAYNEAGRLKPAERDPVTKADEAQKLATAESIDTEDAAYQKILDVGQRSIDEKNYTKAKEMYNRALGFRANDPLPKQKLAEIEVLIKNESDAKKKQAAYNSKVAEAEAAVKSGNLQGAITLFEQAKQIKQDEALPDTRIAELRAKMDGNKADAAEASEKRYTDLMAAGNAAADNKDYNAAINAYKGALGVKPKDKAAQDKISEMQQVLDNEAKKDAKKAEAQKLIAEADTKFRAEDWIKAKNLYEKALTIEPANDYAIKQVQICQQRSEEMTTVQEDIEYKKLINKADESFEKKDYDRAKELYNRAVSFREKDPYPKQRLQEIDDILNTVVAGDPKELDPLGVQTDNSIIEGESKLAEAERIRKNRHNTTLQDGIDEAGDMADSLGKEQQQQTAETALALEGVRQDNSALDEKADQKHLNNAHTLSGIDTEIRNNEIVTSDYETAEHLDAKGQIELANRITEEQSSALNGHADENNEVLKSSKTDLENGNSGQSTAAYEKRLENDKEYMKVQLKIEADVIDDTQQRIDAEHIVRDASNSQIQVTDKNQKRTNQSLDAVKAEVEDVRAEIAANDYESTKQSPLNAEELKKIEQSQNKVVEQDNKNHLDNTMAYRSYVEVVDQHQLETVQMRDDARKNNVDIMQGVVTSQEENDREAYNELIVKNLNSKAAITTEANRQEEYAVDAGKTGSENSEVLKGISVQKEERERLAGAGQEEKHQNTQASLNTTTQTVETNHETGVERATDNQQVLKEMKGSLGTKEQAQVDKQEDKTQSAKQTLANIEKQPQASGDKGKNDLGRLYPEGVSQEQFEQNDEDGLLKAVVTRRVVVRDGYGDIYVRIQTLSGLTYTKNDQPTTEYVWQRETQDAKLKRNY